MNASIFPHKTTYKKHVCDGQPAPHSCTACQWLQVCEVLVIGKQVPAVAQHATGHGEQRNDDPSSILADWATRCTMCD